MALIRSFMYTDLSKAKVKEANKKIKILGKIGKFVFKLEQLFCPFFANQFVPATCFLTLSS